MGSTAATFTPTTFRVETLTGRIGMTSQRLTERAVRRPHEHLARSYAVIERWAVRALTRRECVRVGPVLARDASDEPDLFAWGGMGVRWSVKVAQGPIPGLRPGWFVPVADGVEVLTIPVLRGASGWVQGRIEPFEPEYDIEITTIEIDRDLTRRVAVRAHMLHGERASLGRCVEPDCIAIRELLK